MSIKLIGIDVDGTLTDGTYSIDSKGVMSKTFYTRDFAAIEKAAMAGIKVFIITQADDKVIDRQLERLYHTVWSSEVQQNITLSTGVTNKKNDMSGMLGQEGLRWEELAYIGDAENDKAVLLDAGFRGCPEDSQPEILEVVNRFARTGQGFVSGFGGKGAVEKFIKEVMRKNSLVTL